MGGHTDAWALAEPERRESGRVGRLRFSAASCCRGLTPGRKMGGPLSMTLAPFSRGPRCDALSPAPPPPAVTQRAPSHFPHNTASRSSTAPPTRVADQPSPPTRAWIWPRSELRLSVRRPAARLKPLARRGLAPGLPPGLAPGFPPDLAPVLAPGLAPEHGAVLGPQTRSRTRVPCGVVTTHLPMPKPTTSRRTSSTYACSSATVASASRPCRWHRLRVGLG